MSKLELLVGPIASGKSTYCQQAVIDGKIIVNDDAIVNSLHAGNYLLYDKLLKPLYKSVENTAVQTALILGRTVVVDRPNYSRQMRKRYIALAKSFDCKVEIITFQAESPEIHAQRRTDSDPRGHSYSYWLEVARFHAGLYESPDQEIEHFDTLSEWVFPGKIIALQD